MLGASTENSCISDFIVAFMLVEVDEDIVVLVVDKEEGPGVGGDGVGVIIDKVVIDADSVDAMMNVDVDSGGGMGVINGGLVASLTVDKGAMTVGI